MLRVITPVYFGGGGEGYVVGLVTMVTFNVGVGLCLVMLTSYAGGGLTSLGGSSLNVLTSTGTDAVDSLSRSVS
jgi:hypothetical protein